MNRFLRGVFFLSIILIMSGCSQEQEDNRLEILFFANLPTTLEEKLEMVIGDYTENTKEDYLQIELYPMSMEKLFIELTARSGDIYFVDQSYIHGIIDPLGLHELDEVVDELNIDGLILPEFKDVDPDTNETHIYAVPIDGNSLLMKELGIEKGEAESLGAIIPAYSDNIEESIKILKQLATQSTQ